MGGNELWAIVGHIASIITILTLIPLGFLVRRMQQQWRLRHIRKSMPPAGSDDQIGVLVFNIVADSNMKPRVCNYMKENYPNVNLGTNMFLPKTPFKGKMLPSDLDKFRDEVQLMKLKLEENNIYHVHLFVQGPLILPLIIGDAYANKIRITFHNLDFNTKRYICWGDVRPTSTVR